MAIKPVAVTAESALIEKSSKCYGPSGYLHPNGTFYFFCGGNLAVNTGNGDMHVLKCAPADSEVTLQRTLSVVSADWGVTQASFDTITMVWTVHGDMLHIAYSNYNTSLTTEFRYTRYNLVTDTVQQDKILLASVASENGPTYSQVSVVGRDDGSAVVSTLNSHGERIMGTWYERATYYNVRVNGSVVTVVNPYNSGQEQHDTFTRTRITDKKTDGTYVWAMYAATQTIFPNAQRIQEDGTVSGGTMNVNVATNFSLGMNRPDMRLDSHAYYVNGMITGLTAGSVPSSDYREHIGKETTNSTTLGAGRHESPHSGFRVVGYHVAPDNKRWVMWQTTTGSVKLSWTSWSPAVTGTGGTTVNDTSNWTNITDRTVGNTFSTYHSGLPKSIYDDGVDLLLGLIQGNATDGYEFVFDVLAEPVSMDASSLPSNFSMEVQGFYANEVTFPATTLVATFSETISAETQISLPTYLHTDICSLSDGTYLYAAEDEPLPVSGWYTLSITLRAARKQNSNLLHYLKRKINDGPLDYVSDEAGLLLTDSSGESVGSGGRNYFGRVVDMMAYLLPLQGTTSAQPSQNSLTRPIHSDHSYSVNFTVNHDGAPYGTKIEFFIEKNGQDIPCGTHYLGRGYIPSTSLQLTSKMYVQVDGDTYDSFDDAGSGTIKSRASDSGDTWAGDDFPIYNESIELG